MNFLKKLTPFTLPFLLSACGDDDIEASLYTAPSSYDFPSRTNTASQSSVNYREATTRLVLIKELEHFIGSDYLQKLGTSLVNDLGTIAALSRMTEILNAIYETGTKGGALSLASHNLYNLYDPNNEETSGSTSIKGMSFLNAPPLYSSLTANVNIKDAMPGIITSIPNRQEENSLGEFYGWYITNNLDGDTYADIMVTGWLEMIAKLAIDGDDETKFIQGNNNYQSLIISFLSTSIPYFQIANVHLNPSQGLNAGNSILNQLTDYTPLEHQWDLAFGYYGTMRSANNESLDTIISIPSTPIMDLNSLYTGSVFDMAAATAQRDNDATFHDVYMSENIVNNFLQGREITTLDNPDLVDNDKQALINSKAISIVTGWEKALAATLVHHINRTIDNGASLNDTYKMSWSNMKAHALALQFSPHSTIDLDTLKDIHNAIGQQPHSRSSTINIYLADILEARDTIQAIYNFSDENVQRW